MSLDYQQVREQVAQLGANAPERERERRSRQELALALLHTRAQDVSAIAELVRQVTRKHDPSLRCALPVSEALDAHYALPDLPDQASILAADGSQINPDRHAEVEYGLVNVGAIHFQHGAAQTPATTVRTHLLYDEALYTATGVMSEAMVALLRDEKERSLLAELAQAADPPVFTFTDGPMELWGAKDAGEEAAEFKEHLAVYLQALQRLNDLGAATAGYVDKPHAGLVARTLEVMLTPEEKLSDIKHHHPLRGVSDRFLYEQLLQAGERSALFALQSQSAKQYQESLALHFFYLNVGLEGKPSLARVEIPAWVAGDPALLDQMHALLWAQCSILGGRRYPYVLHRAHETALVKMEERDQVTQMIVAELYRRGVPVGVKSQKQSLKDQPGRASFTARR